MYAVTGVTGLAALAICLYRLLDRHTGTYHIVPCAIVFSPYCGDNVRLRDNIGMPVTTRVQRALN